MESRKVLAEKPGHDCATILGRVALKMLGISPNAELDRTACGQLERSSGAYK